MDQASLTPDGICHELGILTLCIMESNWILHFSLDSSFLTMPDVDGAGLVGDHMEPETHRLRGEFQIVFDRLHCGFAKCFFPVCFWANVVRSIIQYDNILDYRSNTPVPGSSGPSGTVHSVRNVKRCDNTIPAPTRFCAVYPGAPEGPSS